MRTEYLVVKPQGSGEDFQRSVNRLKMIGAYYVAKHKVWVTDRPASDLPLGTVKVLARFDASQGGPSPVADRVARALGVPR